MTKALSQGGRSLDRDRPASRRAAAAQGARGGDDPRERADAPEPADTLEAVMRRLSRAGARRETERQPRGRSTETPAVDVAGIVETATNKAAALIERRVAASERQTAQALEQVAELIENNRPDRAALAEAVAALERRTRDSERKTAQALSGVVDFIERKPAGVEALAGRLDRIENKLAQRDQTGDMRAALRGLDRRIADIARRLDAPAREGSALEPIAASRAAMESGLRAAQPQPEPERPVARAIAEIARRLEAGQARETPGDSEPQDPVEPQRRDTLQSSIDAIARGLEERRADAEASADQHGATMRQIETLRRELAELGEALRDLAPRAAIGALEQAIRALAERVEAQRDSGVNEALLAPVEALAGDLGAMIRDLDPTTLVNHLRGDVDAIGRRLDTLGASSKSNAASLDELWRQTGEIKALLTTLAARPMPLDRLETRLLHLTERVDALSTAASSGVRDVDASVKAIRAIVASETGHAYRILNQRLERLSAKIEEALAGVGGARIDQLAERVGAMHKALAAGIDSASTRKQGEALENLVATLAKKIDASLERKPQGADFDALRAQMQSLESRLTDGGATQALARVEAMLAQSGQSGKFADVSRRLDAIQTALAARREQGEPEQRRMEELLRRVDGKLDAALAPDAGLRDAEALATEVAQLSRKFDRFLEEAPARIEEALAERIEADAQARKAQGEAQLAELVDRLARKIDLALAPNADAGALAALETQIQQLSERLDRNASGALKTLEGQLVALLNRIDEARADPPEALEAAVRRATQEALRDSASPSGEIERDIAALRKTQEERGQLTQQTLSAVHKTLERVVERLASFEAELSGMRGELPEREPREAAASNPPRAAAGASPASVQSEFIAAARRAAQQAAADAEAAKRARAQRRASGQDHPAAENAKPATPANVASLSTALQARKRPLLIGLGGLVLLAGAYQAARVAIEDPRVQEMAGRPAAANRQTAARQEPAPEAAPPQAIASAEQAAPAQPSLLAPAPTSPSGAGGMEKPGKSVAPGFDRTPVGSIDKTAVVQRLAEQGDAAAQFDMGVNFAEGRVVARDFKTAAEWFEKSAAQGMAPAQYRLGALYEKGAGVARDYAKARAWYQRAAEAGNVRAMHNLAVLAAEGQAGKPDYGAAAEWFRKAAEFGVRDSQFNLAILYTRGLGVPQSLANAYMWFAVAAAQGDDDAAKKRDEVGARLDSKELAAAKAMAEAFRPQTPNPAANESRAARGGGEGARPDTGRGGAHGGGDGARPDTGPLGKPKISQF